MFLFVQRVSEGVVGLHNPLLGTRKSLKEVSLPKLVLAGRRKKKWGLWLSLATLYDLILRDFAGKQKGEGKTGVCSH